MIMHTKPPNENMRISNLQSVNNREGVSTVAQHMSQEDALTLGRDAQDMGKQTLSEGLQEPHQKSI